MLYSQSTILTFFQISFAVKKGIHIKKWKKY